MVHNLLPFYPTDSNAGKSDQNNRKCAADTHQEFQYRTWTNYSLSTGLRQLLLVLYVDVDTIQTQKQYLAQRLRER